MKWFDRNFNRVRKLDGSVDLYTSDGPLWASVVRVPGRDVWSCLVKDGDDVVMFDRYGIFEKGLHDTEAAFMRLRK